MMFRRQPVPPQAAPPAQATTIPSPTRGIVQSENDSFMQPGGAIVSDNWMPTMQGVRLRGGSIQWSDLHALDAPAWQNAHAYTIGNRIYDITSKSFWDVAVAHTSMAVPKTFAEQRAANPTYWVNKNATVALTRKPVISAFEYSSGIIHRMFAANDTKLFDVTFPMPTLVASGRTSGNYAASQIANQGGDYLVAVNDKGDAALRFNGTTWANLNVTAPTVWANATSYAINARALDTADNTYWKCLIAHTSAAAGTTFSADRIARPTLWTREFASDGLTWITGPPGTPVETGKNLVYVCKYRNRFFFIELNSMNAWYLPLNAVGGQLLQIPLSGAATKGGRLLFCASWSIDAGDGIVDKLVFATDQGELLIFTGSDPSSAASWRQEGRYQVPAPMGMNSHIAVGGDLLIATVTGIVPTSAAITKDAGQLELAAVTRNIKRMWREHVIEKREWAWSMKKWDEFGGVFVTVPGGKGKNKMCLVVNDATGAWCRMVGYDATCFIRSANDMFFGNQEGRIMQADRGGYDDGMPYTATLVGGWGALSSAPGNTVWLQARATFRTKSGEPFNPQLGACTNYVVTVPTPLAAGPDVGGEDVWDQGQWGTALWDQESIRTAKITNTGWVSIGVTGYTHAPIVQITVGQIAKPSVELVAIDVTYQRAGVNV